MATDQTFSRPRMNSSIRLTDQIALFQGMHPSGLHPSGFRPRSASTISGDISRSRSRSSPPPAWTPFQGLKSKSQANDMISGSCLSPVSEDRPEGSSTDTRDTHNIASMWINGETQQEAMADGACLSDYVTAAFDFEETDDQQRTVLHLAFIHRMSEEFIHCLVELMTTTQLNQRDCRGRRPIDYLLDWEEVNEEIIFTLVMKKAFLTGENSLECRSSLFRLCRRYKDGDRLLRYVWEDMQVTPFQRNEMLHAAVTGGSIVTVKLLLGRQAELTANERYFLQNTETETEVDASMSQENRKRTVSMLLHMAAGARPPRIDLLDLALEDINNLDANKQDRNGDTPLHKVTKNLVERTVPWKASGLIMHKLLNLPNIDLNIRNSEGITPLRYLMASRMSLPSSVLMAWLKHGADFSGGADPTCCKDALYTSPLAELCRRPDGHYLLSRLDSINYNSCLNYMLEAAVRDGSAIMVEMLLYKGAEPNQGNGVLMKYAATSNTDAAKKLSLLPKLGANGSYRNGQGCSVLHMAAQSTTATADVIRACIDPDPNRPVIEQVNASDKKGNTPLHVAAMNKHQDSDVLVRALVQLGGDPNRENIAGESPFSLAVKFSSSDLDLRRRKVVCLLENGCLPTDKHLKQYCGDVAHFRNILSLDASTKSHRPIKLLLCLARYCRDSSKRNNTENYEEALQWRELCVRFENEAIGVMDETAKIRDVLDGVMTNEDIKEAHALGWDKFLARENVGKLMTQMFYCQVDPSNAEEITDKWKLNEWPNHLPILVFLFCLQSLFLPIFLLTSYLSSQDGSLFEKLLVHPQDKPCVTFYSSLVGYLSFLGFLIAHIVLEEKETAFTWIDGVILCYTVAMVTEEMYQIATRKGKYLQTITNYIDDITLMCFIGHFVLKFVGMANDNLLVVRASEHVFAVAAALSCVRVLYYLQVGRKLGPIQIAFGEIAIEVMSFMTILGIVLVAFAVAISGAYGAGMHTPEFKNGNVSLPHLVRGLWPSLQTLYWSLYGQIHYEDLTIEHDALSAETVVGLILFSFWSLVSVIVLLNMLIAVANEAFDRVKKENASVVWTLAVSNIITEIKDSPSFPFPFNLFYLIALFLMKLRNTICCCVCRSGNDTRPQMPNSPRILQGHYRNRMLSRRSGHKEVFSAATTNDGTQLHMTEMSKKVRSLSKQLKGVRSLLQNFVKEGDVTDDEWKTRHLHVDKEDFDDDEQEEQYAVRCERVSYNLGQQTASYEGQTSYPGGCQFLRSPMSDTLQYFEVLIKDYGKHGKIAVGLAKRTAPLDKIFGTDEGSVAFHCVDGKLFNGSDSGIEVAIPSQQDDVVGCGIDLDCADYGKGKSRVFFTLNGEKVCEVTVNVPSCRLFPTVGLGSKGETVKVRLNRRWTPIHDGSKQLYDGKRKDSSSGIVGNKNILRMTEGCFLYDIQSRRLKCTSVRPQVCVFQDLSHPITHQFNYFEAKLRDTGETGEIAVGLAHRHYSLDRMPGWDGGSEAYHCDDGNVYRGLPTKITFSPAKAGDVIGCGLKFSFSKSQGAKVFFTRNGVTFEQCETSIPLGGFYPTIGMLNAGEEVELNFDVKWPTLSPTYRMKSRSERVDVANDLLKYTGDSFAGVGVYQYLRHRMSREFSYYEVVVKNCGKKGAIGVGLASREHPLDMQPGGLVGSIAWHCDDGGLFIGQPSASSYPHPPAEEGDVIGCGIDFEKTQAKRILEKSKFDENEFVVFFTFNGHKIEEATASVQEPEGGLFPTIGMHSPGAMVQLNTSVAGPEGTRVVNRGMGSFRLSAAEEIRVEGNCVSYIANGDNDVGGIQLQKSMQDLTYFEVTINSLGERGTIAIGLAHKDYPLDCQPGYLQGSIAYHCDYGLLFQCGACIEGVASPPSAGDLIGCGIIQSGQEQRIYFTQNGSIIAKKAFTEQQASDLYPTICMQNRGEEVKVNIKQRVSVYSQDHSFSRGESVRIIGTKVYYDPDDYKNVGGVQLNRAISEEYPYFEVRVHNVGADGAIGIGLAPSDYPLDCQPGWLSGSIGFLCDGCLFFGGGCGSQIHQSIAIAIGQTVGCGVDYGGGDKLEVFFAIDGFRISNSLKISPQGELFPTVGINSDGAVVEVMETADYPKPINRSFTLTI